MLAVLLILQAAPSAASIAPPYVDEKSDLSAKMRDVMNTPSPPTAGEVLDAKLPKLRGRAPQYAFDRLGYPDKKMLIGGATIYSWINNDSNIDGGALTCTVKVIVRASKIVSTDFHGNNGACAVYAQSLDPTFHGRY